MAKTSDVLYADTLQRLMNASTGHRQMLVDFFDGKIEPSRKKGTTALMFLVENDKLGCDGETAAVEMLLNIAQEDRALEERLHQQMFPTIVRNVLDVHTLPISSEIGKVLAHLNTLLHMRDGYGAQCCRQQIGESITQRIVKGWGNTLEMISALEWTSAFAQAAHGWTAISSEGADVSPAFLGHALLAAKVCEEGGKFGIASGIYTALGRPTSQLIPLYERAKACNQPIRVDWLERSFDELRYPGSPGSTKRNAVDKLLEIAFGENAPTHPALRQLDDSSLHGPYAKKRSYEMGQNGTVTIVDDPFAAMIVEKFLSRGNWSAACRLLRHPLAWKTQASSERNMRCLLVPAMQSAARREGCIGTAAALGQIALASDAIQSVAEECARREFADRIGTISGQIYEAQAPWTVEYPLELMGGSSSTPTNTEPPELTARYRAICGERSGRSAQIQMALNHAVNEYLDRAIRDGLPLTLNVF